ncbi:hypothetical protein FBU59_000269 [Linderina macrospora]|uniref:Uncharacterized protein n=1 Tax=Linderina macrospora TaxID=4868 RepID=A0ACC1JHC9_9FUNG|nr:hypothetical protein FBU59_000269 [Linderina macrospora]
MMNETIDANDDNDDNEEEGEATSEDVDWEVVDEADNGDEDGIGDNNAPPGRYHPHILDHSDDIQNGHTPTTGSDIRDNGSESHSDDQSFYDAEDGAEPEPTVHDASQSQEPENAAQTRAAGQSMDQSSDGEYMPVLDKIPFVALATSGEWLESLNFFDRIAFLDWIPELGAAVAASYSGNVTIVGLMQKTSTDPGSSKHSFGLRVIARIPQSAQITHKLYGVAIYRRSVDILSQSCSVIIYVVYMDGTMHGYELRPPLFDNVTA